MFIVLFLWLLCAVICAWIANSKGRGMWLWFFMGLFFGIFAIAAILIMSEQEERSNYQRQMPATSKFSEGNKLPKWPEEEKN